MCGDSYELLGLLLLLLHRIETLSVSQRLSHSIPTPSIEGLLSGKPRHQRIIVGASELASRMLLAEWDNRFKLSGFRSFATGEMLERHFVWTKDELGQLTMLLKQILRGAAFHDGFFCATVVTRAHFFHFFWEWNSNKNTLQQSSSWNDGIWAII